MKKLIFISLVLIIKTSLLFGQSDWKFKTEKDGIKIYTGQVAGSNVKAVKVQCELNATTPQLVAMLMDVKTSTDWVYCLKSCVLLKENSPSDLYYYAEVSLPWPVANRDFVAHLTATEDPDTKVVTINGPAVPGYLPAKKGLVRIDNSSSTWLITPRGKDKVEVEYTMHVDPGGAVPSWLVNLFATEGPVKIFNSLRSQLQKQLYKNTELALVEK
jgi:hypothetical protein